MNKCLGCGIEKDLSKLETYPYENDDSSPTTDEPITPIFQNFGCQMNDGSFLYTDICHECWHKLQPDMWMSEDEWNSINPLKPAIALKTKEDTK